MSFDIRTMLNRSLGGRRLRPAPPEVPDAEQNAVEELVESDEDTPETPIGAATRRVEIPDADDLSQGGATAASLLIPEGMGVVPSAAVDTTSENEDDVLDLEQVQELGSLAVLAACIRGRPAMRERQDLLDSLRAMPGLGSLARGEMEAWIDAMLVDGGESDPAEYVDAMESRVQEIADRVPDPELRRAGLQLATFFAGWNGVLDDPEQDLLETIAETFEIPSDEADDLIARTLDEVEDRGLER